MKIVVIFDMPRSTVPEARGRQPSALPRTSRRKVLSMRTLLLTGRISAVVFAVFGALLLLPIGCAGGGSKGATDGPPSGLDGGSGGDTLGAGFPAAVAEKAITTYRMLV